MKIKSENEASKKLQTSQYTNEIVMMTIVDEKMHLPNGFHFKVLKSSELCVVNENIIKSINCSFPPGFRDVVCIMIFLSVLSILHANINKVEVEFIIHFKTSTL